MPDETFDLPAHAVQRSSADPVLLSELAGLKSTVEELRRQNADLMALRQALESDQHRYREVFDLAPDGYVLTDLAGIISEANRTAAALFLVDHDRGELVMKAIAGNFIRLFPLDHRIQLDAGMVGWVGAHGERLLTNDVRTEPHYINFYPEVISTCSELSVPIRAGEQTVGVLDVQSPEFDNFDEHDVQVIETLADQIAVAIANARLYEAAQQARGA